MSDEQMSDEQRSNPQPNAQDEGILYHIGFNKQDDDLKKMFGDVKVMYLKKKYCPVEIQLFTYTLYQPRQRLCWYTLLVSETYM